MDKKKSSLIIIISFVIFWLVLAGLSWFSPSKEISYSERRLLRQMPAIEVKTISNGSFMSDFEDYCKDQFPGRDHFRSLKAITRVYLLSQLDNNEIYVADSFAAKLDYSLNENSIKKATDKFRKLYEEYMQETNVRPYIAVIPDKNYFLAKSNNIPAMDYELLFRMVKEATDFAEYIDITSQLTIDDYYHSDLHWKQENLLPVAEKIAEAMGFSDRFTSNFAVQTSDEDFFGAYAGQSALPLKSDHISYLTNESTENSTVYLPDKDVALPVYNLDSLYGRDPYDVYLSGAQPLLIIENPKAKSQRELVIFRDSFASSLAPLFLDAYAKITLVDIRYMSSEMVGDYIDFDDQDVLFLYNSLILNSSAMLR